MNNMLLSQLKTQKRRFFSRKLTILVQEFQPSPQKKKTTTHAHERVIPTDIQNQNYILRK